MNNDGPEEFDENGQNAYYEDWLWGCRVENQAALASNGQRVTAALALQIAADCMRWTDAEVPETNEWTHNDLRLARAAISGIRAQRGVMGPDAEAFGEPDGLFATRQIDIWVYG